MADMIGSKRVLNVGTKDFRLSASDPDYLRFRFSAPIFDRPKNFIFVRVKKSKTWLTARQIIGADFRPYLADNRKSSVVCFLASSFLFYLKNLTTVLNFLGKINPFQRDNY